MKRGFGNSEGGNSVLGSCQFSCRAKKRFKPIRFSSSLKRWEGGTNQEEEEQIGYLEDQLLTNNKPCNGIFEQVSTNTEQGGGKIGYLPDELVTEVLEWLPIKSVVRFRLVSKSWTALFKTPDFIRNHRLKQQRTKSGTMLLLRRRYIPPGSHNHEVLSFHDLESPEIEVRDQIPILWRLKNLLGRVLLSFRMQGPINGIICIFNDSRFILCNPALHEFKLLPRIPWATTPRGHKRYSRGFGFGASSSEDFKVITFSRFKNLNNQAWVPYVVAYLYNSRSNSWRRFRNSQVSPVQPLSTDAIVLNGAWHWPGRTISSHRKVIVSFDVTSEVFRQLELPDWGFCLDHPNLVVLNNCLGALHHKQRVSNLEPVEVWVMKEYGVKESWNKLFILNPQPFAAAFVPWKNDTMFLLQQPGLADKASSRKKGNFDSEFNAQLTSINLRTSEMKKFQVFGAEFTLRALIYEESLVSLN